MKSAKNRQNILEQYHKDIQFLESLSNTTSTFFTEYKKIGKDKALLRLKRFLKLLGNPDKGLQYIHIAGTSGKGSTVKILEALISSTNVKVGTFTSPFATTSLEKISVCGVLINPESLHNIVENKIKPTLDDYIEKYNSDLPSYFEVFFALALLYFKEQKCKLVILEAGLGGTYDATNIIEKPKVTTITNIGLDHMRILGNTKEKIAHDKAGIIKKGAYFFTAETNPALIKIFKAKCKREGARYRELIKTPKKDYGAYFSTKKQKQNLELAFSILDVLKIKPKNTKKITREFKLPARQEIIQNNPTVIIDGAHNDDKLKNVAEFVKKQNFKKLHLIFGVAEEKKYEKGLKELLAISNRVYLTRFLLPFRKAEDLRKLKRICKKYFHKEIQIFLDPRMALSTALKEADKNDIILITGSFFLAGELRKYWIPEEK